MSTNLFHPIIRSWFENNFHSPTDIQQQAWPVIADRRHVLITAPTGSGKTLTAFLWGINQFATGQLETGQTRILYISPLKALNNDIQRNLLSPLAGLKESFAAAGQTFPNLRVQTRSGDTDQADRRRMLREPPEILITTPESLNLMLSSQGGQGILQSLDTVILDEIHGVVDSKRGVYLMTAIERLVPLSGEFQRIALSATINPIDEIARLVGGYERLDTRYRAREVEILTSTSHKRYDVSVRYPDAAANRPIDQKIWDSLAKDFVERIEKNASTLIFVNSRALCEKLTYKINEAAGRLLAYAHHGSLSREIRSSVEQKLKAGELAAIVATSTLEMGIDIGALDEVLLVQSPGSIASTIQRIGRAGHGVGETSVCSIYPTHPQDFVEAVVLGKAVLAGDIEAISPIYAPLDVLAQVIVSMVSTRTWSLGELLAEIRRSTAYQDLSQVHFDLVIGMLTGRYADNHLRELRPRVIVDRLTNTIEGKRGSQMQLFLSGGVIPDRGYYQLRTEDGYNRVGELDEEFVWEARVGQVFSFGTQHWQVRKITHNDVLVSPGKSSGLEPPFWKSEPISRNFHYSQRIGQFLEDANLAVEDPGFKQTLRRDYLADDNVADTIVDFLSRQKSHTHRDLPHRHHLLIEKIASGPHGAAGTQIVLHTCWGAMVNRPLAMALEAAFEDRYGEMPEVHTANESIVIQLPRKVTAIDLLELVPASDIEDLLRTRLEGSGFFGSRFRENAGRALLLSKGKFNERKPLWMSRLQSQRLMESVGRFEDFPILLETWRTCLQDEFDIASLTLLLKEIDSREIAVSEVETTSPSPFAQSVAWDQVNDYMYRDDTPKSRAESRLNPTLLQSVVQTPGLRPAVSAELAASFETRRQRLYESYLPEDDEILEWVKERTLIPISEWQTLESLRGISIPLDEHNLTRIDQLIVAAEDEEQFRSALGSPDADITVLLGNLLQYYGPMTIDRLASMTAITASRLRDALTVLVDDDQLIHGQLIQHDTAHFYCDPTNFEFLLRRMRQAHRLEVEPEPLSSLPGFLRHWQQHDAPANKDDALYHSLDLLRCLPVPCELIEAELLPARIPGYDTRELDLAFQDGNLAWIGVADRQVTLVPAEDVDLLPTHQVQNSVVPGTNARYEFSTLQDATGLGTGELTTRLWEEAFSGIVTNDTYATLRKGIETKFKGGELPAKGLAGSRRIRRGSFARWRAGTPFGGNWYRLQYLETDDLLSLEELARERARVVLDRYGVVFRELLLKELPGFQWRDIFRSLRLMELSGEVNSGHFFKDIPGPQFILPAALRVLQSPSSNEIYWINARDPVSLCGLGLLDGLPRRVSGNHLVYHGSELVIISERAGKSLTIAVPTDHEDLPRYLNFLSHLLHRSFNALKKVSIEFINNEPARQSNYIDVLSARFNLVSDYKQVYLEREFLGSE